MQILAEGLCIGELIGEYLNIVIWDGDKFEIEIRQKDNRLLLAILYKQVSETWNV